MPLSRRRLLRACAGGLAATACRRLPGGAPPGDTAAGQLPFPQPRVLRSRQGALATTLRVTKSEVRLWEESGARSVVTRAYDGAVPGPTLRVRPGDRLDLLLVNEMPPEPPPCGGAWSGEDRPHGFDTTNLHTHGLHVSPASVYADGGSEPASRGERPVLASDDVLLAVAPGESQRYRIWLPAFHAPGTHWYHAHKHGSAALQVGSGLAGALIVEEEPGHELTAAEDDLVWVIHEALGEGAPAIYTRNSPPLASTSTAPTAPPSPLAPASSSAGASSTPPARWAGMRASACSTPPASRSLCI